VWNLGYRMGKESETEAHFRGDVPRSGRPSACEAVHFVVLRAKGTEDPGCFRMSAMDGGLRNLRKVPHFRGLHIPL